MQTPTVLKHRSIRLALILLYLSVGTYVAAQPFDLKFDRLPKQQIAFTSVAFEQGPHLQFRYQLSGVDTGWVAAGSDRRAYYAALPAGDYRFLVMVANREGDWQATPAVLSFTILPPFYTQSWFHVLGLLLGLGLFYFGIRIWEGKRKKRHLSRRRIAEDLHGQVGLALNSILQLSSDFHLSVNSREPEFLERIEQQTLLAAEKLSDLVWLINPENDTFDQFVRRVRDVAHKQLAPLGITPTLLIEKEADQGALPIEKRKELYLNFKATLTELIAQQSFSQVQIRIARENRQLKMELLLQGACPSPILPEPEPPKVGQVTLLSTP